MIDEPIIAEPEEGETTSRPGSRPKWTMSSTWFAGDRPADRVSRLLETERRAWRG